jgi:hypothetical protein
MNELIRENSFWTSGLKIATAVRNTDYFFETHPGTGESLVTRKSLVPVAKAQLCILQTGLLRTAGRSVIQPSGLVSPLEQRG